MNRVRLGVLTNPSARHNYRFPFAHRDITHHLVSKADAVITAKKEETTDAIRHLLFDREINVLAINGGDGTIHSAINAIYWLCDRVSFPVLLLLNGGTYNMASRAMGTKGDPVNTVSRFIERYKNKDIKSVRTRRVGVLSIEPKGSNRVFGLVFGSQVVANALDLCDKLGSGYVGLGLLLFKGVWGYLLNTDFFRQNLWRLIPDRTCVVIDGERIDGVIGAVASTIDLKIARGLIWSLTIDSSQEGFHAKVVRAKTPHEIVRLLPYLLWEIPHPMIITRPKAGSLSVFGDYTVDGELFKHNDEIEVKDAGFTVQVVCGEEL